MNALKWVLCLLLLNWPGLGWSKLDAAMLPETLELV